MIGPDGFDGVAYGSIYYLKFDGCYNVAPYHAFPLVT